MYELASMVKDTESRKVTYNRNGIMSLAWSLKKAMNCTLSEALKKAWKSAKAAKKALIEKKEVYYFDTYTCFVNLWEKYGKVRGYWYTRRYVSGKDKFLDYEMGTYTNYAA